MNKQTTTQEIWLIRHGQTTMNAKGKCFSGRSDVSLSDRGIEMTARAGKHPMLKKAGELYVTPLRRTWQTADLLFGADYPRTIVPELIEMDFGDYEGKMITPDAEINDPIIRMWVNEPEQLTFPGGENLQEHADMAYQALLRTVQSSEATNLVFVAHATTIRLILATILGSGIHCFRQIPCDNSCITRLTFDGEKFTIKMINMPLI